MKLIKRLLDKLHKLVEELQNVVIRYDEKKENVRLDKLYRLRLDRGLSMLGLPSIKWGPGHIRYANYRHRDLSREDSLLNTLEKEAADNMVEHRLELASLEAMKVELPATKSKRLRVLAKRTKVKISSINQDVFAKWLGAIIGAILAILVVGLLANWLGFLAPTSSPQDGITISNPQPVEESKPDKCPAPSFVLNPTFNANPNDDWKEGGYAPLGTAKTEQEAIDAHNGYMKDVIYPSTANLYGYVSAYVSVVDIEIGSTNYDKTAVNKLGFDRFYQHKLVKEVLAKYKDNPNGLSVDGCANGDAIRLKNYMESFAFDANAEDVTATGGVNTGIKPNGEVIYYDGKNITGNLDSIKVTYKLQDGTLIPVYELRRCANPVFSHKHRHHKDHDKEDKPKCKGDSCNLTPKSSNPRDYKKPGDDNKKDSGSGSKPKVPKVTQPAETTPPPVQTSQSGGGGVTDSSTSKPGSESGTTAPEAKPADNKPREVPTNEGGTNDGVVSDD